MLPGSIVSVFNCDMVTHCLEEWPDTDILRAVYLTVGDVLHSRNVLCHDMYAFLKPCDICTLLSTHSKSYNGVPNHVIVGDPGST